MQLARVDADGLGQHISRSAMVSLGLKGSTDLYRARRAAKQDSPATAATAYYSCEAIMVS
jgi:hypothetical protein